MEPINEKKLLIRVETEKGGSPIIIPIEVGFILWGRVDLIGLYVSLVFLSEITSDYITQPRLAKIIGFSYPIYLKKRKELEQKGLLQVKIENHNFTRIILASKRLWGLKESLRGSLTFLKTPPTLWNDKEFLNYIDNAGKTLTKALIEGSKEVGQLELVDNIYINSSSKNNITDNSKINKIVNKVITYPKEDYNLVIDAFKKYKGVGLMGPEITYHLRAIKLMFQAEHKPKEIIDFMKWLHDNEKNEETSWVKTWTIWTVQKKLPEFVGGKLKVGNSIEEEFPAYDK